MKGESAHPMTNFADENIRWQVDFPANTDETTQLVSQDETELKDFFRRPALLTRITWTVNGTIASDFDPWSAFLIDNVYVANRINNYRFVRGNLKLKFAINGNPMYFGRMMVSYMPLATNNYPTTITNMVEQADLVTLSQCPHIFLDPTSSTGADMTLPFIWKFNGVNLISGDEVGLLGRLIFRQLSTLKHANGGTDSIGITVYGWMDDVEMFAPTSTNMDGLLNQSGEYEEKHLISRTANAVSAAASKLTDVPVIGKYAKATELASGAMADVAKLYGYSKPVNQSPTQSYVPRFLNGLASGVDLDTSVPLSLDKKVELTVDPMTLGPLTEDEMDILNIAKKESYIGKFTWATTNAFKTGLGTIRNNPSHYMAASDDGRCLSAISFASSMFGYWRGSITYRFQIVASNFHRGRLLFRFDSHSSIIPNYGWNTVYSRIVDISEEKDFSITLNWANERPWLEVPWVLGDGNNFDPGALGAVTTRATDNGVLSVSVLNPLTEPAAQADTVDINVFVSAGDDFEVCFPIESQLLKESSPFPPQNQSGEHIVDEEDDRANQPELGETTDIMPITPSTKLYDVFMGDPIRSFRTILKRYVQTDILSLLEDSAYYSVNWRLPARPFVPGWDPNGIHDSAGVSLNYVRNNAFTLMSLAYRVYRGSFRWKYYFHSMGNETCPTVALSNSIGNVYSKATETFTNFPSEAGSASLLGSTGHSGMVTTAPTQNPTLEFTIPWYTNARWTTGSNASILSTTYFIQPEERGVNLCSVNTGALVLTRFFAMGDDAVFAMFCGLPRMYRWYPTPPPSQV